MKRVKTGFRLILLAGLVLVCSAIVAYGVSQSILVVDASRSARLDRLADEGMELVHLTHAVLQYPGPRTLEQWRNQFDDTRTLFADTARAHADLAALLERPATRMEVLGALEGKLAVARENKAIGIRSPEISEILAAQLFQEAAQLQSSLKPLRAAASAGVQQAYEQARIRQIVIFVLFAVLATAFGVAVSLAFGKRILKPLSDLEQTINDIGAGQHRRAPVLVADEIGAICTAFNRLLDQQDAAETKLKASEAGYRALIEHAPDAIVVFDVDANTFVDANPSAVTLFGCSREVLLHSGPRTFHPLANAPAGQAEQRFEERLTRVLAGEELEFVETVQTADGRSIVCEVRLTLLPSEHDKLIRASFVDITEREQAKQEILTLNNELEQRVIDRTAELERANKELEAFAYSVSHDLRAPLRAIDGFAEALQEDLGDKLGDEGNRYLATIRRNASNMGKLIADILRFSRMSREEMTMAPIDMTALARDVFEEARGAAAPERKIVLALADLPPALGDEAMVRQVLVNLVANAIKFTGERAEAVIEVGGRTQAGENAYWVKDNGAGFDMQYAGKLFGVFQRLHSVQEFQGTGIGLAIVKRVVNRHGGRVWAEGKVGEGATMHFTLPGA